MRTAALVVLLALTTASAQANSTDLWNLLGSSDSPLLGGDVVYRLSGGGSAVEVGVTFGEVKGDGYTELRLTAFKFSSAFTPTELRLFGANIKRLATQCFNSDPSRGPAIVAWVVNNDAVEAHVYQTAGVRLAHRDFGPLQLEIDKRVNGHGHAVTVYMSRIGTPGAAPWVKSCIASG